MENFFELVKHLEDGYFFKFIAFNPTNPHLLFLWIDDRLVLYDINKSTLELVCDFFAQGWRLGYFMFHRHMAYLAATTYCLIVDLNCMFNCYLVVNYVHVINFLLKSLPL